MQLTAMLSGNLEEVTGNLVSINEEAWYMTTIFLIIRTIFTWKKKICLSEV